MKKQPYEEMRAMKLDFYKKIDEGAIDIRSASKLMRKIVGLNQHEYAEKILKISPRVLIDFERGVGNPTLKTLQRIASPFGLEVGFVKKKRQKE